MECEFKINVCNKCICVNDIENNYTILYLYVDDILIVSINDKTIKSIKEVLNSKFDMKNISLTEVTRIIVACLEYRPIQSNIYRKIEACLSII